MMNETNPESRAVTRLISAEEREEAVRLLTVAFADDAIAVDEFEQRVAAVYKAENAEALREVTRDLPEPAPVQANVPARVTQSSSVARRPSQRLSSFLSSIERDVDGPMPERLAVRSIMGSLELDLRRADFPPGVTEIHVDALMGNIELELPRHIRVENEGRAFLGNLSVKGRSHAARDADTPVVRITGRSIMANVEIELD